MAVPTVHGILNNDQGPFHNKPSKRVKDYPIFDLAYLSNDCGDETTVEIELNPICLTWCDFMTLFFHPRDGAFWINPANASFAGISLYGQTYESTPKKCIAFSLADQIRKAWSKKTSKPMTAIPVQTNIQLNRSEFLTKSLAAVRHTVVGLSLDETISTLLSAGSIEAGTYDDKATVHFVITYRDYFAPLNVGVVIKFIYETSIPCYKNVNECDGFCPYSKDTAKCRPCVSYPDDDTTLASSLFGGFDTSTVATSKGQLSDDSDTSSGQDTQSVHSDDSTDFKTIISNSANTNVLSQLSDILKSTTTGQSETSSVSSATW